ncbi:LacI family DNA-binding transcriptional regulator [Botrimarina sp.]|uniref:LacI family DNA-binding transcriptional regulator n=1 Tax=Botrimarina sp. TaxID=2795802 RepID=UPI0032EE5B11
MGLVYATDDYLFEGVHSDIFLGITRTLHAGGFHLAFCPLQDDRGWRHVIEESRIDGAFLFGVPPRPVADALRRQCIPQVMLATDADPTAPTVVVDDVAGGRMAAEHLLELGHHEILFWVHPEIAEHCSVGQRIEGYAEAMRDHGAAPRTLFRQPVDAVRAAVTARSRRATAIVCYCDHEALVVQHMLWREGLSAPRDLSVIAFNDKKSMQLMTPPLTTIGFDAERIGSAGAEAMIRLIRSGGAPTVAGATMSIAPRLIVRESTAPPNEGRRRASEPNRVAKRPHLQNTIALSE